MAENLVRYKVTVTVTTPEGEKTGYAVREAGRSSELSILPEQGGVTYGVLKGEAVVVDLGKHGVLFVLMGVFGRQGEAQEVFKLYAEQGKKGHVVLTSNQYPTFVRFRDLNDPKTIENVRRLGDALTSEIKQEDPRRPIIDFEKAFGAGVNIRGVTVEIASDSVTWKIEKYLPWLKNVYGYITGKHIDGPEWYERLDSGYFQRRPR